MKKRVIIFLILLCALFGGYMSYSIVRTLHRRMKPDHQTICNMRFVFVGICEYRKQYGAWPTNVFDVRQVSPDIELFDAWNMKLILRPYSGTNSYGALISYGADFRSGGDGMDKDIILRFDERSLP